MKLKYKFTIDMVLTIMLAPLLILILWSITVKWPYPYLIPKEYSLRSFEYIFNKKNIDIILKSAILSICIATLTVLISIPAARAIVFYEFKGKKLFNMLIISPIIIPMVSIAMGVNIFFIRLGIANSYIGVIIINILPCIPYAIKLISDVYKLMGNKIETQARLLGADKFKTFRYVTLPLIAPGIIGALSMCFIISFSQYFLTMLIGGGSIVTYPMIMFPYIQSGDRSIASMSSLVFLIVSILILIIIENRIKKYSKISEINLYI